MASRAQVSALRGHGSGHAAFYDTRMAALWDDTYLYIGFWMEEPYLEAHLTERDAIIFQENDVEIFIDGGDCYYESEINALGTPYEVMFVWKDAYTRGSRFDVPEFDLLERQAFSFAGDYDRRRADSFWRGTHPRGPRWAFLDLGLPGLQVAVADRRNAQRSQRRRQRLDVRDRAALVRHGLAGRRAQPAAPGRRRVAHLLRSFSEVDERRQRSLAPSGLGAQPAWDLRHPSARPLPRCDAFRIGMFLTARMGNTGIRWREAPFNTQAVAPVVDDLIVCMFAEAQPKRIKNYVLETADRPCQPTLFTGRLDSRRRLRFVSRLNRETERAAG